MSIGDWLTVALTVGFSSLCSAYAQDFKKFIDGTVKAVVKKIRSFFKS